MCESFSALHYTGLIYPPLTPKEICLCTSIREIIPKVEVGVTSKVGRERERETHTHTERDRERGGGGTSMLWLVHVFLGRTLCTNRS